MKSILKVFYFCFVVMYGVIIALGISQSNKSEQLLTAVRTAVDQKDTKLLLQYHGYTGDTDYVYSKDEDNVKIEVVKGANIFVKTFNTTEKDNDGNNIAKTVYKAENDYTFILYNPTFSIKNVNLGNKTVNYAGFKFINSVNAKEYFYPLIANADVNSDYYKGDKIYSYEEASLYEDPYGNFDGIAYDSLINNLNCLLFNVNETMVSEIEKSIGNIDKVVITDNEGSSVSELDVDFDFTTTQTQFEKDSDGYPLLDGYKTTGELFEDTALYIEFYNKYFEDYEKDQNKANEKFNSFINDTENNKGFQSLFLEHESYTMGRVEPYNNTTIFFQTAGLIALYIVAAGIIYFLLFHMSTVKRLIFRNNDKNQNNSKRTYKYTGSNKKESAINAEVKEVKEETPKDNN